jgi:arginase
VYFVQFNTYPSQIKLPSIFVMDHFVRPNSCALIGAPVETGTKDRGCLMGPDAYRAAGLSDTLQDLGLIVEDLGNLILPEQGEATHENMNIHGLSQTRGWIEVIAKATYAAAKTHDMPIILGGDHSIAAGSIPALAKHAADEDRPFFVLWLDAHPDLHRLETTQSGNLHGTPMAYALGCDGFDAAYPPLMQHVEAANVCMIGLRSVDRAERDLISDLGLDVHDMRAIDEHGIKRPVAAFLERVAAANGRLHVSLDVDFLDPDIACAVGTTVPGGATFREAHLVMELLHDSGLVTSLDLVELNPSLDERGRTARLMVDLTASLMGRTVLDKPTQRY